MSRVMRTAAAVVYPSADDRPMAESDAQLGAMLYLLTALRIRTRDRSDVFVGGDLFVYYEEGNSAAVVAPDVMVVIGAPKRAEAPRPSYKLWEEQKGPDFVLEVASRSPWAVDRDEKRGGGGGVCIARCGGILAVRPDGEAFRDAAARDASGGRWLPGAGAAGAGARSGSRRKFAWSPDGAQYGTGARCARGPRGWIAPVRPGDRKGFAGVLRRNTSPARPPRRGWPSWRRWCRNFGSDALGPGATSTSSCCGPGLGRRSGCRPPP